jgi:hypothetical protein
MTPDEVLTTLPVSAWHGPFDPALQTRAQDALESGRVLFLPNLPFLVPAEERDLLDPAVLGGNRKNVSLNPAGGSVTGARAGTEPRLAAMLERFAAGAVSLVRDLLPGYAGSLQRARTSFRPAEIEGRAYSPRHDDRLLHVDAFPTTPLCGRRILRLFTNIAPDGASREWRVGEPFGDFARVFLPRVRPPLPGSAWVLAATGITKGRRSRYDHLMLGLHDSGKLDAAYQHNAPAAPVSFPAGATWLCFTDQVLHAALSGRCALEQTMHLPVQAMGDPARSPLRVLEALVGRPLA